VLLVGETGIGKTRICKLISEIYSQNLTSINLHSNTEASDFLGTFCLENSEIAWRDGPLVTAMINGDILLLDEINLAENSVIERLNALLENDDLYLPETDRTIKRHGQFKVIATMNPGTDFGKKELSPALRNRFTEIYYEIEKDIYFEIIKNLSERVIDDNKNNDDDNKNDDFNNDDNKNDNKN
ncbi:Midasin, partial [Dictyocoela roeselum]